MQDVTTATSPPIGLPAILRRIRRNAGVLLGGNALVAVLGLVALTLNSRALGTAGLGTFVLISTIGGLLDRLFALQSWQALVKLGSDAIAAGDTHRLRQLIATAVLFDCGTALIASVVGIGIVLTAAPWIGIDSAYAPLAALYMATIATRITDAPIGILRLHDRFGTIIAVQVAGAGLSCLLAAALFLLQAPLGTYIIGYAIMGVISNVLLLATALAITNAAGAGPSWPQSDTVRSFWSFSWATGLSGTIGTVRQQGLVLLVGGLLGPSATGVYHVAERIAGSLGLLMSPLGQAIWPESARLSASGRHHDLHRIVVTVGLAGGGIGLAAVAAFAWLGTDIISLISGPTYAEAHWPLVILASGYLAALLGLGARSAVIVGVSPRAMLTCNLIGLAAIGAAPFGIQYLGLLGAAAAHAAFDALWLAAVLWFYLRWCRGRQ